MNYFNNQNRGTYNISHNGGNPFYTYFGQDNQTPGTVKYTITEDKADLPYPESELLVAPVLSKAPVAFDFSKIKY